jgi:hypothetical protein
LDDYVLGLIVKYEFSRVQKKKIKNVFLREFPKKLVCLISSKIYQIKICFILSICQLLKLFLTSIFYSEKKLKSGASEFLWPNIFTTIEK